MNALRLESPNIHIMTVNVGPIDTPFHQKKADPSMKYAKKRWGKTMLDANQFVEDIIYALKQNNWKLIAPNGWHHALKMCQIAPRF